MFCARLSVGYVYNWRISKRQGRVFSVLTILQVNIYGLKLGTQGFDYLELDTEGLNY